MRTLAAPGHGVPVTATHIAGQPFLRWAGSKRQLVKRLAEYWPQHAERYVEPFAGSACLYFHLAPERAILGDLNCDLMNAYTNVQTDVERVIECLHRLPPGKQEYYRIRSIRPEALTPAEQAARLIYLNKHCFNGLYRTNQSGQFNVPFGDTKGFCSADESRLRSASTLLQGAQIVCGDFEETLRLTLPGDFVYLDPPYVVTHRRGFTEYQPAAFAVDDLERFQTSLVSLDNRGISFLVSYAESREATLLTDNWNWQRVQTRRSIAGFSGSRGTATEVLVTNMTGRGEHG